MRVYKFAGIPVAVKTRGSAFGSKCKDYLVENEEPFFEILATNEDLQFELTRAEEDSSHGRGYLEYIALYRKFCEKALDYGVVLCHGSVVEVDGRAYLFSAPSGTGKSTHTTLPWHKTTP